MTPDATRIPEELKRISQWVAWRSTERDGKVTKMPVNAKTGTAGSSTNPDTWASFETAWRGYERLGCDGPGFVFTPDDDFSGIDLDRCLTAGKIAPWAMRIIRSVPTYWEISPSGTGVKGVLRGKLAGSGRKFKVEDGEVEIYSAGRYFAITGAHLEGTPRTIEARQDELDELVRELSTELEGRKNSGESRSNGQASNRQYSSSRKEIYDELRRLIASHPTSAKRPDGAIHCQGICHSGKSKGSSGALVLFPTGAIHCTSGCDTATILRAFGLQDSFVQEEAWPDEDDAPRGKSTDYDGDQREEGDAHKETPAARPWIDIEPGLDDNSVLIGPGRFLTRGAGCFVVAQTGSGKSTLTSTLAFSWALRRQSLGFDPSAALKSLIIQAEDDDGDLADMRRGILSALGPTDSERETLRQLVLIVTERSVTGVRFLQNVVRPLLEEYRPDLLWINPLSAYFGGDLNDQEAVAKFFRNTLNPILAEFQCAAIIVHHSPKPNMERKAWTGGDLAYLGAGSGDLANWSRETIVLRSTAPGLYEMTCTKRWRKLGWIDADGKPTATRLIAHGTGGSMFWREASPDVLRDLGAQQYSDQSLLELIPADGIDKAVLIKDVSATFAISERTATSYINGAGKPHLRNRDGKSVRCALLTFTERPRREVYPGEPANRPVVWVTKESGNANRY